MRFLSKAFFYYFEFLDIEYIRAISWWLVDVMKINVVFHRIWRKFTHVVVKNLKDFLYNLQSFKPRVCRWISDQNRNQNKLAYFI